MIRTEGGQSPIKVDNKIKLEFLYIFDVTTCNMYSKMCTAGPNLYKIKDIFLLNFMHHCIQFHVNLTCTCTFQNKKSSKLTIGFHAG